MSDLEWDREEPEAFVYDGWRREPLPAEPAATPVRCPDCGGRGSILLLITTRPCTRCGGTGLVAPAPAQPGAADPRTLPPAGAEPPKTFEPPLSMDFCRYWYEDDVPTREDRFFCTDGQWWMERYVVIEGEWQFDSRTPAPSPYKSATESGPAQ